MVKTSGEKATIEVLGILRFSPRGELEKKLRIMRSSMLYEKDTVSLSQVRSVARLFKCDLLKLLAREEIALRYGEGGIERGDVSR